MTHRLNTNKQFMIGNGILAFAVIIVVVIFVYMSMRTQQEKQGHHHFTEQYTLTLERGFAGDSVRLLLNDSLLMERRLTEMPVTLSLTRFAEHNTLFFVDAQTDGLALFELSEQGGNYRFEKENGEVKMLAGQKE
jgi:hypothetical protein